MQKNYKRVLHSTHFPQLIIDKSMRLTLYIANLISPYSHYA